MKIYFDVIGALTGVSIGLDMSMYVASVQFKAHQSVGEMKRRDSRSISAWISLGKELRLGSLFQSPYQLKETPNCDTTWCSKYLFKSLNLPRAIEGCLTFLKVDDSADVYIHTSPYSLQALPIEILPIHACYCYVCPSGALALGLISTLVRYMWLPKW